MGERKDAATAYGEADIEAKAMADAAKGKRGDDAPPAPPADQLVPTAGTTETDLAGNRREKLRRESKN